MTDAPAPGWYPNPSNAVAEWRWWNGSAWTADVAPRQDAPVRRSLEWTDARSAYRDDSLRTEENGNTAWIWLLAFSSLLYGSASAVVRGICLAIPLLDSTASALIAWVAGLVLLLVFAHLDGRDLRRRGFEAPSILWMLVLTPLVYFAVRARKLRRVNAFSKGPERALLIVIAVQVLLVIGVTLLLVGGYLPEFPEIVSRF